MNGNESRKPIGQIVQIDKARIRDHLGTMERGPVEESLDAMLDAAGDRRLCVFGRYRRSATRTDMKADSHERSFDWEVGKVHPEISWLLRHTFATAIIARFQCRESSLEEALNEKHLDGLSLRRAEDTAETQWGTQVNSGPVSNLNKEAYAKIDKWRRRRTEGAHPYVFFHRIVMNRSWASEVRILSLPVAIGETTDDRHEIFGIVSGRKGEKSGPLSFLCHAVDRGLSGIKLFAPDACRGLAQSATQILLEALWQRSAVLFFCILEIRHRTRVVGAFPDGKSCLNHAAARIRHIAGTHSSIHKCMNMTPLFAYQTQGAVVA